MRNYSITELLRAIERLPATTPSTERLEKSGYATHQDHWTTWLGQYNDADGGYYGRSDKTVTDAKTVFQRLNCAPMIIWLGEASGISPVIVRMALNALRKAEEEGKNEAAKAAVVRRVITWEAVADQI